MWTVWGEVWTINYEGYMSLHDQSRQQHCFEKYSACYWVIKNRHNFFESSHNRMYDNRETTKYLMVLIKKITAKNYYCAAFLCNQLAHRLHSYCKRSSGNRARPLWSAFWASFVFSTLLHTQWAVFHTVQPFLNQITKWTELKTFQTYNRICKCC